MLAAREYSHRTGRTAGLRRAVEQRLGIETSGIRARFEANIAPWREGVTVDVGDSADVLRVLSDAYDFIYIDGSHLAPDVLADAVLGWRLLKPGGIMIFDDFLWNLLPRPERRPGTAIRSFLLCHAGWFDVLRVDGQMAIRKRAACEPDMPQPRATPTTVFEGTEVKFHV